MKKRMSTQEAAAIGEWNDEGFVVLWVNGGGRVFGVGGGGDGVSAGRREWVLVCVSRGGGRGGGLRTQSHLAVG